MEDDTQSAFDPSNLPDHVNLSMSVMASCFAVLLCTLEQTLSVPEADRKRVFRECLDRNLESVYAESKHVDSTATHQAQQWAFARLQTMRWIREHLEEIRRYEDL